MEEMAEVVIVGGGIAGLATAVALKRVGVKALVLERAEELRATGTALTLFPNAWLALDALSVSHKLTPLYPPILKGSVTNVATGAIQEIHFSSTIPNEGNPLKLGPRSVNRKVLLETLAQELPVDSIRFSCKISAITSQETEGAPISILHLEDGTTIKAKVLIGCDGVHSVVTKYLGLAAPVHSGRSAVRGLTVFPQGHGFKHEVLQFVDVGKRAGFVPINDTEVFWFLTFKGEINTTDPKLIQKEVTENLARNFPEAYLDVVRNADLSSLTTAPLKLRYPWHILMGTLSKKNVTVAGDAMHPMTPDLAQGGCSALEDAVVLGRHIGESIIKRGKEGMGGAVEGYVKERRWRAAGLVTASYLSGWVQQDGSSWWMKFLRDAVFYRYLVRFAKIADYDCGKLPLPVCSHHPLDYSDDKKLE